MSFIPIKTDFVPPKGKKKIKSKKRKSAWRKTDIKDVENFLENEQLEERIGKSLKKLKDIDVFQIDASPDKKLLTRKERRKIKANAPVKCYSILQPHTKVPDPITKRNRVRSREERRCPIVKKRENERKLKGILTKKELQRVSERQKDEIRREEAKKKDLVDIWVDDDDKKNDEWIESVTKRHTLRGTGKLNKVIPRMKNTLNGVLPKVENPHPGMSYNPSYKDHQDLLREVAEKEMKLIKEEKHLDRVTKDIFRKIPMELNEKNWMKEMSQGLPNIDSNYNKKEDKIKKDSKEKNPYDSVNPPVVNKKKTLKQRRKIKEQLELKETLKKAKIEKRKIADIYKLKFINSEINKDEQASQKKQEIRGKVKASKAKETKRLGKLKFEEPELEFNMGDEIAGNLRNVKMEGNLLKDRFNSFQKRNVLDVTKKQKLKKGKVKKFVKASFKNWETTVVK